MRHIKPLVPDMAHLIQIFVRNIHPCDRHHIPTPGFHEIKSLRYRNNCLIVWCPPPSSDTSLNGEMI